MFPNLSQHLDKFDSLRVLIVGDVMIDAYIWGGHTRMSPEAPVPVVDVQQREARLGGAANVALNIQAAGAEALILTVLGDQGKSEEYRSLMQAVGLSTMGLVSSTERSCTVKTRIISNNRHMMRVDEEDRSLLNEADEEQLLNQFDILMDTQSIDAVILQDYNKGVLTPKVIEQVLLRSDARGIPTMVDPKHEHFLSFKEASLFKPNLKELREGLGIKLEQIGLENLDKATIELRVKMPHKQTLITLSEHGVYWNDGNKSGIIPVFERNIVDVSGAGDTVIAIAALALAAGASLQEGAWLADLAGGLVCEHVGVQPIDKEALLTEVMSHNH